MDTITYKIHLNKSNTFKKTNEEYLNEEYGYLREDDEFQKSKFYELVQALQINKGKSVVQIEYNDVRNIQDRDLVKLLVDYDKKKFNILYHNVRINLDSSESGINFYYDNIKKVIVIELSAPKFFYGNNVCELYPNMKSKYYDTPLQKESLMKFYIKIIKHIIKEIILQLTEGLLVLTDDHYADIQLFRIDLSYNQIHEDKKNAFLYLNAQKKIKPPRVNGIGNYDESIFYVTENYSFKIYHKGTEFEKIQKKKILNEHNAIVGKKTTTDTSQQLTEQQKSYLSSNKYLTFKNTDKLQEYADSILRYEIRISARQMSYTFASKMLKINIPSYDKLRKAVYFLMENEFEPIKNCKQYLTKQECLYVKEKIIYDNPLIKSQFQKHYYTIEIVNGIRSKVKITDEKLLHRIKKVKRLFELSKKIAGTKTIHEVKTLYKWLVSEDSKQYCFFLGRQPSDRDWYTSDKNRLLVEVNQNQYFEPAHLLINYKFFEKLFLHFQLDKLPSHLQFVKSAEKLNEQIELGSSKRKNKININRVKILSQYLKNGTLADLKNIGNVSRATYYRMKKEIKLMTGNEINNFTIGDTFSDVEKNMENLFSKQYTINFHKNHVINLFVL